MKTTVTTWFIMHHIQYPCRYSGLQERQDTAVYGLFGTLTTRRGNRKKGERTHPGDGSFREALE
jgi:hypothetical protein